MVPRYLGTIILTWRNVALYADDMSIKHFANLSQKRRTEFLEHPERFKYQEKIDGSNFIVGMTDGQLWTSRKSGTQRYYDVDEWPIMPWTKQFRAVHWTCSEIFKMRTRLGNAPTDDFVLNCEILSRNYPNTVKYYFSTNEASLTDNLKLVAFDASEEHDWLIRSSAGAGMPAMSTQDGISLVEYRYTFDIFVTTLDTMDCVHSAGDIAGETVEEQEQKLLDRYYVSTHRGQFFADRIEGWVFKHVTDGWMVKLVDREDFTARNKINNSFNTQIFRTPRRLSNSVADQLERDLLGGMETRKAVDLARSRAYAVLKQYLDNPATDYSRHIRNMEAMASFLTELEKNNGR